jgi:hypothetical protein
VTRGFASSFDDLLFGIAEMPRIDQGSVKGESGASERE